MESLELGERNLALNGFDPDSQAEGVAGDVFQVLRDWRTDGERFDVIILDPPKFAHTQQQVERAGARRTRTSTCWPCSCCVLAAR